MDGVACRSARAVLAALLISLGLATEARAGVRVRGVVTDSGEQVVAGAEVVLVADDGSVADQDTTDPQGKFKVSTKRAKQTMRVRAFKAGYAPVEQLLPPDSGSVLNLHVVLMAEAEAAAQEAALKAVESRSRATSLYNEGALAYNAGDRETAAEKFNQAVAEDDSLTAAFAGLARIYLELRRWPLAEQAARKLAELEPGEAGPQLLIYDSLHGGGSLVEAAALLDRLAETAPGDGVATRLFNEGVAAVQAGDAVVARERFAFALQIDPELRDSHLMLADLLAQSGEHSQALQQVDAYLEHLEHEEGNEHAHTIRIQSLRALGRSEEADEALVEFATKFPHVAFAMHFDKGVGLFREGRAREAARELEQAVAIDSTHARARYQLGLVYASLGRKPQAREELQEFLRLAPEDSEAAAAREMLGYL